ncbi:MAG: hypothetical protein ACLPX5_04550 [Dissulfurispiraceae bacterium]
MNRNSRLEAAGRQKILRPLVCAISYIVLLATFCYPLSNRGIQTMQSQIKEMPLGDRIAFWAEKFVGVPYDNNPIGEYVAKSTIVADERVDCMYLVFRSVELAMSNTPEEASIIALDKRFHSKGIFENDMIVNYNDRFRYGEDMIESGKWGLDITAELGQTVRIRDSRRRFIDILPAEALQTGLERLESGDIIFFIKAPKKRSAGEIVGHMGIIKIEGAVQDTAIVRTVYLIHASGIKGKGGMVKKSLLSSYLLHMHFVGAKITRFH